MNWIERGVSNAITALAKQGDLSDPWVRKVVRLRILQSITTSRRIGKRKAREAKIVFAKELDDYITNAGLHPRPEGWNFGGESIPYHYGRVLALSVAVELATGEASERVAKAIQAESSALCESYSRWAEHILDKWGQSIHSAHS